MFPGINMGIMFTILHLLLLVCLVFTQSIARMPPIIPGVKLAPREIAIKVPASMSTARQELTASNIITQNLSKKENQPSISP